MLNRRYRVQLTVSASYDYVPNLVDSLTALSRFLLYATLTCKQRRKREAVAEAA